MYDDDATMMGNSLRAKAILVVRQGTQAGMSYPLTKNLMTLGREEGTDIVLQDAESSRHHARIGWQGGQFVIEDLGSTNGTFVNGVQITGPQPLTPGDSIGIGQTALVFQVTDTQSLPQYNLNTPQSPPHPQPPVYQDASHPEDDNTLQYILYGLGCVFLLGICFLLCLISFILIYPEMFGRMIGL